MIGRRFKMDRDAICYIFAFLIVFAALFALSEAMSGPKRTDGPYYFLRAGSYKEFPPHLYDEVTQEIAKDRRSYYEAYFDNKGRVVNLTAYLDGNEKFTYRCRYKNGKAIPY